MAPSIWQILIVVFVFMLLFGAGRLPRMMEDLAKGITSFKKGLQEDDEAKDKILENQASAKDTNSTKEEQK